MCVILNVRKYDPVKFLNGVISEAKILYSRLSIYSHFYPMFDHAKKKKRNGINKHSKVKTKYVCLPGSQKSRSIYIVFSMPKYSTVSYNTHSTV